MRFLCQLAVVATATCLSLSAAVPPRADTPARPAGATAPTKQTVVGKAVNKKRKPKAVKEPVQEAPQPAPIPLTPEQMPASPPQVSFQNGQLTVQSQNSTLGDILTAIRRQTGAQIEVPSGANNQRIATRIGPAPARDVLTLLLNGAGFDYVILGSPQNPGGVQRVILTGKHSGSAQGAPAVAQGAPPFGQNPQQRPAPNVAAEPPSEGEEDVEQSPVAEEPPPPDQPEPEQQPQPNVGQPAMPQGQQPGSEQQQQQFGPMQQQGPNSNQQNPNLQSPNQQGPSDQQGSGEQPNPNQPQVKTPDQLLQELQRMQQQQQQQQQQPQEQQEPPQ